MAAYEKGDRQERVDCRNSRPAAIWNSELSLIGRHAARTGRSILATELARLFPV